jgi:hypothetical protein
VELAGRFEDVAREVGVSNHAIWKAVADLSLDKEALQSVIRKNGGSSVHPCSYVVSEISLILLTRTTVSWRASWTPELHSERLVVNSSLTKSDATSVGGAKV